MTFDRHSRFSVHAFGKSTERHDRTTVHDFDQLIGTVGFLFLPLVSQQKDMTGLLYMTLTS